MLYPVISPQDHHALSRADGVLYRGQFVAVGVEGRVVDRTRYVADHGQPAELPDGRGADHPDGRVPPHIDA